MFVNVNDKNYKVYWKHEDTCTKCFIMDTNTRDVEREGMCLKHPNDRYVKEAGRKISLRRALKDFVKTNRTIFWDAYFNR